jgi:hypothetical protein
MISLLLLFRATKYAPLIIDITAFLWMRQRLFSPQTAEQIKKLTISSVLPEMVSFDRVVKLNNQLFYKILSEMVSNEPNSKSKN